MRQHPKEITLAGSLLVAIALTVGLAGKSGDFVSALGSAPMWMLGVAIFMHVVWLVARSEAWNVCVGAAGGTVGRRRLYRAASVGYLGNLFNAQFGLAVRIGALRRSAPTDSPPRRSWSPRSSPSSSSRARSRPSCHSPSSPPWALPGGCP